MSDNKSILIKLLKVMAAYFGLYAIHYLILPNTPIHGRYGITGYFDISQYIMSISILLFPVFDIIYLKSNIFFGFLGIVLYSTCVYIYDANAANFTRQEDSVRLQLIVFNTSDSAKANQVLKEAIANPADFTSYARKYNANIQGVTENGETQEIPLTQLSSRFGPLNEAIKDVKAGQIVNKVVTVGNDLYVVKVLERNGKGLIPFEKVKETIKTQLRNQKRQVEQQKYLKSISDEFKLSNMDEALKNIK